MPSKRRILPLHLHFADAKIKKEISIGSGAGNRAAPVFTKIKNKKENSMKKILATLLAVSMILLTLIPFAVTTVSADTFNASDANPTITTAADLKAFLESGSDFNGKTITLQNDITLNADTTTSGWYNAGGVVTINLSTNNRAWFNGTFDGQGYTIKGLVVKTYGGWHKGCGMFSGVNNGATIKDFTLDGFYVCDPDTSGNDATVSYGYCGAGAVVGHAKSGATLDGITLKNGTVTCVANGYAGIGSLVGAYDGDGSRTFAITDCTVENTVTLAAGAGATTFIGGMVGYFEDNNKSDYTVLDLTGSAIGPAGSNSSLGAFGRFKANGSSGFRWTIKNDTTSYSKNFYPDVNGTDNASSFNALIAETGAYGYEEDTISISTAEELKTFLETNSDFEGKTITLENDITLNADTTTSGWYNAGGVVKVTPTATYFKGTFDGNGYTIKGLVVKASVSWAKEAGMFPGAMGATIKDFTLDGFYVCNTDTSGNDGTVSYGQCGTAAIVGHGKSGVTIDGVTVKNGTVTCVANGYAGIGSLVGAYDGDGATFAVTNCTVENTVTLAAGAGATTYIGGIVGYFWGNNQSDYTIMDLSNSVIQPAGADSTIAPFGCFMATGGTTFRWNFKNTSALYDTRFYPTTGGTDNASEVNALIVASCCYGSTAAKNVFNASDSSPKVSSKADLKAFLETNANFSGKTVTLANDITLNADTTSNGWYNAGGVVQVAPTATYFQGTFNGNGHTIKGLVVKANVSWAQEAGMFPGARGATIQNFTLDGFYVCNTGTTGNDGMVGYGQCSAGAVVGHAKENVTIDGVTVKNGTVTCVDNGYAGIGSIVGCYDGQIANQVLAITNCVVEPSVTLVAGAGATAYVGGLIGYVHENYKSHPTSIDVTGSVIDPADSDTIEPIGWFKAGGAAGDNKFLWSVNNDTTDYYEDQELTGNTDYTDLFNGFVRASGCYGTVVKLAGVQEKDSGNAVRFVGLFKCDDPENDLKQAVTPYLGFELTVGEQTADLAKTSCTKVYESILAGGDTVDAPSGYYYFTFVVTGITSQTTFEIRARATVNGVDYYSTVGSYTFTPSV